MIKPHVNISWRAIKERHGYKCVSCGLKETPSEPLTKDHIVPLSLGGCKGLANIQPMCRECNLKKGNGTINQKKPGKPHSRLKPIPEIKDEKFADNTTKLIYGIDAY